jgi:hypothetical protein
MTMPKMSVDEVLKTLEEIKNSWTEPMGEDVKYHNSILVAISIIKQQEALVKALESLVDEEECSFDHHGYCQTHFSGSSPCVMEEARKVLAPFQKKG